MDTTVLDRSRLPSASPSDGGRSAGDGLLAAIRAAIAVVSRELAPPLPDMAEANDRELARFAGQEPIQERLERTRSALLLKGGRLLQ